MLGRAVRTLFGTAFILLLFFPFGVYHSMAEPFISGFLWGFKLPVGWIGLIIGSMLLAYPKLPLDRISPFGYLVAIGAALVLASLEVPIRPEAVVNFWHGTNIPYDVDKYYTYTAFVRSLCMPIIVIGFLIGSLEVLLRRYKA